MNIRFTGHALRRMAEYGLAEHDVMRVVLFCEPLPAEEGCSAHVVTAAEVLVAPSLAPLLGVRVIVNHRGAIVTAFRRRWVEGRASA
jgi:hypothetical protein